MDTLMDSCKTRMLDMAAADVDEMERTPMPSSESLPMLSATTGAKQSISLCQMVEKYVRCYFKFHEWQIEHVE